MGTRPQVSLRLHLGTHTFTLTVNDGKGGTAADAVVVTVDDPTPPTLTLSTNIVTVTFPTATMIGASVDLSGVATATDVCDSTVTVSHDAPDLFPRGPTVVTFTAANDNGNFIQDTLIVQVVYEFDGFLPPIETDGLSIFKSGRTLPIKFQLTAADGTLITDATANLAVFQIIDENTLQAVEFGASGSSNIGNLFRFDEDQYIYDLSTRGFSPGAYLRVVSLNDGTAYSVQVSIR